MKNPQRADKFKDRFKGSSTTNFLLSFSGRPGMKQVKIRIGTAKLKSSMLVAF